MSSDVAIRVENLSKKYRLGRRREARDRLSHVLHDAARGTLRRLLRGAERAEPEEEFYALRDVSFEARRGEVLGVIGRNGAGKSTLLKVLSRITEPTSGRVGINGRVASLLEVGTGFHPDFTGRENIFLNGALLGMSRAEITAKFDEIVAFAEVERFLDTPVKRYSSGMYVRLAFAVAAHLEPDILIVDEVLAVGDAAFQRKCLGKMGEVVGRGERTVIFVSHNMDAVLALCGRALVLEQGHAQAPTSTRAAVTRYLSGGTDEPLASRPRMSYSGRAPILTHFEMRSDSGVTDKFACGEAVEFDVGLSGLEGVPAVVCSVVILNEGLQRLVMLNSLYHSNLAPRGTRKMRLTCKVPSLNLTPGRYVIELSVGSADMEVLERVENAAYLEIFFSDALGTGRIPSYRQGHFVIPSTWAAEADDAD